MHDSISFEQLDKPGLAVCTMPFESNVRNLARVMGLADFPFILVDHPLGSGTIDEIKERASQAYAQRMVWTSPLPARRVRTAGRAVQWSAP